MRVCVCVFVCKKTVVVLCVSESTERSCRWAWQRLKGLICQVGVCVLIPVCTHVQSLCVCIVCKALSLRGRDIGLSDESRAGIWMQVNS